MPAYIGTSGFSYKEWRGIFYPDEMPEREFLAHYASRFKAVEIDSTFYRMPTASSLLAWQTATPPGFLFSIKASRRITHQNPLAVPSSPLVYLGQILPQLGDRLGAVLFQLPPYFRCDRERLSAFLEGMPGGLRPVLEFRHASWFSDDIYALLAKHRAALCIHDSDEGATPSRLTADFTYVRLRRQAYSQDERDSWRQRFRQWVADGIDVFAFIKHKDNPEAPRIALAFADGLAP